MIDSNIVKNIQDIVKTPAFDRKSTIKRKATVMLPKRARMNPDDHSSLSASYLDDSALSGEDKNDPSKTSKSKKMKRKKKAMRKDTLARDAQSTV